MAKPKTQDPRTVKHQREVLAAKKRIDIQTEAAQSWARENCSTQRPAKTLEFARNLDKALANKVSKHLRAPIKKRIDDAQKAHDFHPGDSSKPVEEVVDEDGVIHHLPRTPSAAGVGTPSQKAKRAEKSSRSVKSRSGATQNNTRSGEADHLIDDLFAQWSNEESGEP